MGKMTNPLKWREHSPYEWGEWAIETYNLGKQMDKELDRESITAQLAGYLSTFDEFKDRHPQDMVPLAKYCVTGLEKITGQKIVPESELSDLDGKSRGKLD